MYLKRSQAASPARFGFIVAKNVGGAVSRNLVRRRLKAVAYEVVTALEPGTDVVIRALPGAVDVPWSTLRSEVVDALDKRSARA